MKIQNERLRDKKRYEVTKRDKDRYKETKRDKEKYKDTQSKMLVHLVGYSEGVPTRRPERLLPDQRVNLDAGRTTAVQLHLKRKKKEIMRQRER